MPTVKNLIRLFLASSASKKNVCNSIGTLPKRPSKRGKIKREAVTVSLFIFLHILKLDRFSERSDKITSAIRLETEKLLL